MNNENKAKIDDVSSQINSSTSSNEASSKNSKENNSEKEDYHKLQLLLIKKYKLNEIDLKNNDPEINTLRYIEEKVYYWIEQDKVKGVIYHFESNFKKNVTTNLAN